MKVIIRYKHWKTGAELVSSGKIIHDNPQSDRLVLQRDDGTHIDILRSTVIERKVIL